MKLLGAPQPNLPPTEPPHQGFSSSGQPEQVHGPPGPPSPRGRRRREAAAMAAARGSLTAALRRRGAGHVTQREREGALQAGAGPRGRGRASRSAPPPPPGVGVCAAKDAGSCVRPRRPSPSPAAVRPAQAGPLPPGRRAVSRELLLPPRVLVVARVWGGMGRERTRRCSSQNYSSRRASRPGNLRGGGGKMAAAKMSRRGG